MRAQYFVHRVPFWLVLQRRTIEPQRLAYAPLTDAKGAARAFPDLGRTELAVLFLPEMNCVLVHAGLPREVRDRHTG